MYSNKIQKKEIAGIETLYLEGDENGSHIVLFHGYGANAEDLASLSSVLAIGQNPKPHWYFPNGILNIDLGFHYFGKAWFPIDMVALQSTKARDYANIIPKGLDTARLKILEFLKTIKIDNSKLILGGFSQGAMISADVCLHLEQNIQGLILLSGTLVCQEIWKNLALKKVSQTFIQSHGIHDPILDIHAARKMCNIFKEAGMIGDLYEVACGHEIPFPVIEAVNSYLEKVL